MSQKTATLNSTARHASTEPASARLFAVYAATLFLSAFLLFQVQLIVSKYILPWFGGSAAVWTTSMLVFQMLLLAGYVYSHLISVRLAPGRQLRVHFTLLTVSALAVIGLLLRWPSAITPAISWRPAGSANPVWDVAMVLLIAAGLPFFVLSTSAPLLQSWFGRFGHNQAYRLYSVSNLGSLLGLLTFPFLFEPALRTRTLGMVWSVLFCVFVAGCAWCAWSARSSSAPGIP